MSVYIAMWMRAFYCFLIKRMVNFDEGQKHLSFPYCCLVIFCMPGPPKVYFTFWIGFNQTIIVWSGRWERQVEVNKTDQSFSGFRKKLVARMVVPTCHWPEMIGQVSVDGKALPKRLSLQALSSWEALTRTWAREVMFKDCSYVLAIQ